MTDEIAEVNPQVFLILTGEPLLRKEILDLAVDAAEKDFTVVLGTNGVLLRDKQAKLMRQHGVVGASISLDSTNPPGTTLSVTSRGLGRRGAGDESVTDRGARLLD